MAEQAPLSRSCLWVGGSKDISVPITHDTLTYDLSTRVSRGGWDNHPRLSAFLHALPTWLTPGGWIRDEAITHGLNVTEQLNAGVRWLDFRLMKNGPDASKDSYTLHFVQGNTRVGEYFSAIRSWVDAHPGEVVLIYTSRHGGVCERGEDAFPGVKDEEKRALWGEMKKSFEGVSFDASKSRLNETSLNSMVSSNQRVIFAIGSWEEFTGGDRMAIDACADFCRDEMCCNIPDQGVESSGAEEEEEEEEETDTPTKGEETEAKNEVELEEAETARVRRLKHSPVALSATAKERAEVRSIFFADYQMWMKRLDGREVIKAAKRTNRLASIWLPGSPPEDGQMLDAAILKFSPVPWGKREVLFRCILRYNIIGMNKWCPPTLLDNSQLGNYYLQMALEDAHRKGLRFPSVAVNALDENGTIRVGTERLVPEREKRRNQVARRYAFVATLLASNLRWACEKGGAEASACIRLKEEVEEKRKKFPLVLWDDPNRGRHPYLP
uniref:Phosphatidylinositol-specific phospholipase C X domain-containing protein n=1 Tax=Chromera velia CCMP2878 TaxID=1169474 RepID=A0A0G4FDC4_9ALVE|eukprot:Cvel_16352.t1-p1 / transcript=Cvel_16352.t1 / gene=Cvel_16352 / organism=Chromera_velia_CCMP2878 / gene_product=PI-PLC X domain-containing protein 1, putative / transcript_product=PI-PLC X domain-containing protein 1, putative / location=Cvel_scaffold1255:40529-43468(+) / protein_length=496 / sequence_SO=supercontig / SO=protein_coding / is_pseudo=false